VLPHAFQPLRTASYRKIRRKESELATRDVVFPFFFLPKNRNVAFEINVTSLPRSKCVSSPFGMEIRSKSSAFPEADLESREFCLSSETRAPIIGTIDCAERRSIVNERDSRLMRDAASRIADRIVGSLINMETSGKLQRRRDRARKREKKRGSRSFTGIS